MYSGIELTVATSCVCLHVYIFYVVCCLSMDNADSNLVLACSFATAQT